MAAVTIVSKRFNYAGALRHNVYEVTGGNGDTLDVGLLKVRRVNSGADGSGITAVAIAADTPAKGQSRLTITSGGAYTSALLEVLGT